MRTFDRPRYFFCWWCSLRLRGRSHWIMSMDGQAPVSVHRECSEEMKLEGWGSAESPSEFEKFMIASRTAA